MRFERKHAILLLAVAIWNFVTWGNFAKNLAEAHAAGEERATGYWVAHTGLIVANVLIGIVLGLLGLKALRGARAARS